MKYEEEENLCHSVNTLHSCVEPNEALWKEEIVRLHLFFTELLYASLPVKTLGMFFFIGHSLIFHCHCFSVSAEFILVTVRQEIIYPHKNKSELCKLG